MPRDPFCLDDLTLRKGHAVTTVARPLISWLLRLDTYRRLYEAVREADGPFEKRALEVLRVQPRLPDLDLSSIPELGSLIVASNHPHGALDGLVLASIIRQRRRDVRILTNYLLSRIPELRELCFFVDPFAGSAANARSLAGLRAARLWLRNGGALVVFPAGEVAYRAGTSETPVDSPWQSTVGRLAMEAGASVVPALIEGRNSRLFYAAGQLHPSLRTALLARELLKKRGRAVQVRLGAALTTQAIAAAGSAMAATTVIRQQVDRLIDHEPPPIVCNSPAELSVREVARLAADQCLVDSGAFQVFVAEAVRIPATLAEIGRLREITYRAVGEGTGNPTDLDSFDSRYLHLFSWDRERRQLVGAYRIGLTDRIMACEGIHGLYTRTLFRYDDRLITRLPPALELGRSFIRLEYQKNYNALLLLWRGIGQFVSRHPWYRVLFGPVSISSRYSDRSHRLLMAFLHQNHLHRDLAVLVEPLHPVVPAPPPASAIPSSVDQVDRLVAETERDGKGIPILLRQYLKLNAQLLGFNVDPKFGDALDALMMVDLVSVNVSILNRYLGRQGAAAFLAHHRAAQPASAA